MKITTISPDTYNQVQRGSGLAHAWASAQVVLRRHELEFELAQSPLYSTTQAFEGGMAAIVAAGLESELPEQVRDLYQRILEDKADIEAGAKPAHSTAHPRNFYTSTRIFDDFGLVPI